MQAQMVVTAPSLEVQEAMNHVEQMQQAVQTYQTMMGVKQGIEKTVDAVEKVNSKLATRECIPGRTEVYIPSWPVCC